MPKDKKHAHKKNNFDRPTFARSKLHRSATSTRAMVKLTLILIIQIRCELTVKCFLFCRNKRSVRETFTTESDSLAPSLLSDVVCVYYIDMTGR